jgi:hypothetical protein
MASAARFRGPAGVFDGLSRATFPAFLPVGEKKMRFLRKKFDFFLAYCKKVVYLRREA